MANFNHYELFFRNKGCHGNDERYTTFISHHRKGSKMNTEAALKAAARHFGCDSKPEDFEIIDIFRIN